MNRGAWRALGLQGFWHDWSDWACMHWQYKWINLIIHSARTLSPAPCLALCPGNLLCCAENKDVVDYEVRRPVLWLVSKGSASRSSERDCSPCWLWEKKKKNPKRCELWAGAGKRDPPERKAGRQRNEAVHTQAWEGLDLHNKPSSPDAKSLLSSPPDPVASGGWWLKQLTVWRLHTGLALEHTFLVKWRVFNLVILLSFTTLSISASWT